MAAVIFLSRDLSALKFERIDFELRLANFL